MGGKGGKYLRCVCLCVAFSHLFSFLRKDHFLKWSVVGTPCILEWGGKDPGFEL